MTEWPFVSIITPTLNAHLVLEDCLKSIATQDYPPDKVELLVADGGSQDKTTELAEKYGAKIIENVLKTGEAGKAAALKSARGEFVIFIDSDNILPDKDWLKKMIQPILNHSEAVGSEPWGYTWRRQDGFIARYCALIGVNDPLVHFIGNYDRLNLLTGKWTEIKHEEKNLGNYLLVKFNEKAGVPTIGANGTVFRKSFLDENFKGDYLFDIDVVSKYLKEKGEVSFIKVKEGIIHTYCESSILKFARKQERRVRDFMYHRALGGRDDWVLSGTDKKVAIFKFILYCVTVVPLLGQAVLGYSKKKDLAWFFHPLACEITLFEYTFGVLGSFFKKSEANRNAWSQ